MEKGVPVNKITSGVIAKMVNASLPASANRCALIIALHILLVLTMQIVVAADASMGKVIDVRGDTIFIELTSGDTPAIGDTAELSFELGGEEFVIGTWKVNKISGPVVEAEKLEADLAAENGMTVRFASGVAATTSVKSRKPVEPAAKESTTDTPSLEFRRTSEFQPVWKDIGSGAYEDFAVWRPVARDGFYPLGDVSNTSPWQGERYGSPSFETLLVKGGKPPVDYQKVWDSQGSFSDKPFSSWQPVAPQGYRCLGEVGSRSLDQKPPRDSIHCVPEKCVTETRLEKKIWEDKGSGADLDFTAWLVPVTNTYIGIAAHAKPRGIFYTISNECL